MTRITLLSCLGKLFTSILSRRLNDFSDYFDILKENQTGFRAKYSTLDNIFVLHSLIELCLSSKKKLFCSFIDFKGAFDSVWRAGLWRKLLQYNINGKCLRVIVNMYNDCKSRIALNNEYSNYFPCKIGVRQGENLSPLLFALFLNDFEDYLVSSNVVGVDHISDEMENELNVFLKVMLILYADDAVLMSNSQEDLQLQLDCLHSYCQLWKLKVNVDKTKL